jgi:nucleoside-diphosphate-sugar epimerase
MSRHEIFVTGATGYIGRALVPALLARGHHVRVLVRPGSERKAATGAVCMHGDALDASTYRDCVAPADTFVHLVGTRIPRRGKAGSSGKSILRRYALRSMRQHTHA